MHPIVRNSTVFRFVTFVRDLATWSQNGFVAPSPHFIKQAVLLRNSIPGGIWVETGTYLGETTAVLARAGAQVYTIEPQLALFEQATRTFASKKNVSVLLGSSEDLFPSLVPRLSGNVNFWLDGHFSAGNTFRGSHDTPIEVELGSIATNIANFENLCVAVDDIRCFAGGAPGYPRVEMLVEWANSNGLSWHIEHDIFFARRTVRPSD